MVLAGFQDNTMEKKLLLKNLNQWRIEEPSFTPSPHPKPHLLLRQAVSHMYIPQKLPIGFSHMFLLLAMPQHDHHVSLIPTLLSVWDISFNETWNESLGCYLLPCILDWILSIVYMDILGLVFDIERLYKKEIMLVPSALKRPASPGTAFILLVHTRCPIF